MKTFGSLVQCPPGRGARRARRNQPARGRDRAGRRAAGQRARRLLGRRAARRAHRRPGGLGAAPRRRARGAGSRPAARARRPRPAGNPRRRLRAGRIDGLVVGGIDPADLPDPAAAREALARVPFLVSLELRHSAVTELADVVFPVAAAVEKAGTFVDWEGRERPFAAALPDVTTMTDLRVLHSLAAEMGVALGLPGVEQARSELLGARPPRATARTPPRRSPPSPPRELAAGEAILATWSWLLDDGRMQDGEPHLAGTRKLPRAAPVGGHGSGHRRRARRPGEGRLRRRRVPARSRCRWSSPTCPTAWSGCRPPVPARTSARSSGPLTATSCGSPSRCFTAQEVSS